MVFQRIIKHKSFAIAGISLAIALMLALLTLSSVSLPILSFLELKTQDLRFHLRGAELPASAVAIVAIDEKSLQLIGRWPWPRNIIAGLIAELDRAGARAIGVDLLLSEAEINPGLELVQKLIHDYQQLKLSDTSAANQAFFEEMIEYAETADNDVLLAEILRESGNVALALAFHPAAGTTAGDAAALEPLAIEINVGAGSAALAAHPDLGPVIPLPPIPLFAESAAAVGFVNVEPDLDGCVRRARLIRQHQGRYYPSLALAMAQAYMQKADPADFLTGSDAISLDANGEMLIDYHGPTYTIPYYSAVDVLSGTLPPECFKGKSILIGGAASGLGDHWVNPFSERFWGVEIQATIISNIIAGKSLKRPPRLKYVDAAITLLIGLALALALPRLNIRGAVALTLALTLLLIMASQFLFNVHKIVLLWLPPILAVFFISAAVFFYLYAGEGREKRILKHAFQHYLNPGIVERIMHNPEKLHLGGEERELTVMFSDIRGFTIISESLTPEALVQFMNQYLMAMTDILIENGGTLDKYIGDAIMAIFGAPEEQPDHAGRCCKTATEMLQTLKTLRIDWQNHKLPAIHIGIGISTGKMVVGNVGSMKRFNYTVMGDAVNLASRLESLTKQYGVDVIVNEETRNQAGDLFRFRELDLVQVKGKIKPARIYELLTQEALPPEFLSAFEAGLTAYRQMELDVAGSNFERALKLMPTDHPSQLFIARCQAMKCGQSPPLQDGVFVYTEK